MDRHARTRTLSSAAYRPSVQRCAGRAHHCRSAGRRLQFHIFGEYNAPDRHGSVRPLLLALERLVRSPLRGRRLAAGGIPGAARRASLPQYFHAVLPSILPPGTRRQADPRRMRRIPLLHGNADRSRRRAVADGRDHGRMRHHAQSRRMTGDADGAVAGGEREGARASQVEERGYSSAVFVRDEAERTFGAGRIGLSDRIIDGDVSASVLSFQRGRRR
mmetsp:Transcript_4329/g.12092  ORF Transcript_4329/g.12092 Transcript_4329/m.12092 type:complete len:218 (+) Transcript_4329:988-1641(+)